MALLPSGSPSLYRELIHVPFGRVFGTRQDYGQSVSVIGICVSPSSLPGKTTASVVVASGTAAAPLLEDSFEVKTSASEDGDKVVDIARAVSSKLSSVGFTDVVIRTADFFRGRGAALGTLGAQCEGAIILALREKVDSSVKLRRGRDIGVVLGCTKAEAESSGAGLAPAHPKAGAAALSALPSS